MTTTTVTVRTLDESDPAVLHHHYEHAVDRQECFVKLDLDDGELWAQYDVKIGDGVPTRLWDVIVLAWTIPCLTAQSANWLLRDVAPLAERVLAGATVEWNGSNNVGVLDEAAQAAVEEIQGLIDGVEFTHAYELVQEMDASEWWSEGNLPKELTAYTTDEELAKLIAAEVPNAATTSSGHYLVLLGADAFLTARREEMREAFREWLEAVSDQHARLEHTRDQLIALLTSWGDSSRTIAARVPLSHMTVQNVAKRTQLPAPGELSSPPVDEASDQH